MKTKVQFITVKLIWTFHDGASLVRSNVVGNYQAEVDAKSLRIYSTKGECVTNEQILNRREGMSTAAYRIGKLIQGQI